GRDHAGPKLLYVGMGVLVLGRVLAVAGRRGKETAVPRKTHPPGPVALLDQAPSVAPPRAEVAWLVGGNGASEPSVRWYHVAAATLTGVTAPKARISVAVRGEEVRAERWQWQTGEDAVDVMQTGARIPIVIGGGRESGEALGAGGVIPCTNWDRTPNAI